MMRLDGVWVLARRELALLFLSPAAWLILAAMVLIVGLLFLTQLDGYLKLQPRLVLLESAPGITHMVVAPVYGLTATVMMFVSPLLTMGTIAGERQQGRLPLLQSAPLSSSAIVLGKWLGLWLFNLLILALISLMPLSLLLIGSLDMGRWAAASLALLLLLSAYSALGLWLSSWTAQPLLAALLSFVCLIGLRLLDWAGRSSDDPDNVLRLVSIQQHLDRLLLGVFDSADLAYFVLLIGLCLALTVRRLESLRVRG